MTSGEHDDGRVPAVDGTRDAGSEPKPAILPQPTYWPAVLAFAACFALWGVLTSVWLIVAGLAGTLAAVAGWYGELRDAEEE